MNISQSEIKAINEIERMIKASSLEQMKKIGIIQKIEEEFEKYAYLKSLIAMKRDGHI